MSGPNWSRSAPSSAKHRQGRDAPKKKVEEAKPFPVPSERADRTTGYLEFCQLFLATHLEEVRDFLMLAWVLGAVDDRVSYRRPHLMTPDQVVREGWWLLWTGTVPS